MDTKALAKSKRAHSQHHSKKHHPNTTLKTPLVGSGGASTGKKPPGKQVREKPHQSQGSSALPSNWDRYDEEYDSGAEDPSHNMMSQATDVVVPKSKGADYGHLISEAKSQSLADISPEGLPSFDDVLSDFNQGVGSLLSVRGQDILSWTGDDNFVVEDRATASHEASFLSLNLHLLAEQLAKVELSQRLFIEPELLPPELCTEELKTSFGAEPDEVQAEFPSEGLKKRSDELAAAYLNHDGDKMDDQANEFVSPNSSALRHSVSTSSNQGLKSMNQSTDELNQSCGTSGSTVQYYREPLDGTSVANPKKASSRIEAAAAEAELDFLLDSFSETKFLDSSDVTKKFSDSFSVQQEETSSRQAAAELSRKGPDLSIPVSVATNFDDSLDDLLNETSSGDTFSARQQETSTSLSGGILSVESALAQPLRKGPDSSKLSSVAASFDDALDDLLKETSNPTTNQKGKSQSNEVITTLLNTTTTSSSSSSGRVSKVTVLDDFDSWFE